MRARSGSAAERAAGTNLEAAQTIMKELTTSPVSVQAALALEVASRDEAKGAELARSLPEPAKRWVFANLARTAAASRPEQAEAYVKEAGASTELVALVAARMAPVDRERALRLVGGLPEEAREAALIEVAIALAPAHTEQAREVVQEILGDARAGSGLGGGGLPDRA